MTKKKKPEWAFVSPAELSWIVEKRRLSEKVVEARKPGLWAVANAEGSDLRSLRGRALQVAQLREGGVRRTM